VGFFALTNLIRETHMADFAMASIVKWITADYCDKKTSIGGYIMIFKNIAMLDENLNFRTNMYIGVIDEKIEYIGSTLPDKNYGEVYDGKGKLAMNAFYNAHAHSPMALLRGYGENMNLYDWLTKKIFLFEAKMNGDDVYWSMYLSMAESIRNGIVSSTDMYYFCDRMADVVLKTGVKNNISRGIANFGAEAEDVRKLPCYTESEQLFKNYHNAGNGKIKIDMSLHAEYTSNPDTVASVRELARELGANMHIHLSETRGEHEECKVRHKKTPAKYFYDLGLFDLKTTAAHCVWLEGEDFDILAQKGVTVATCPVSNMKLASGIANIPLLLKKGVNVALGTDGVSSNNNLNMIEEMKFMACGAKVRDNDPTALTPKEVIYSATKAGAKAQGREDCGTLKVGNKADIIVLDIDKPHMQPVHDMVTSVVYSASGSDIVFTMSDGKILYKDGEYKTIDIEKAVFEADKSTTRILAELE
jgi:5-methylthioadenosine/S-adenosylhomocysteine deaminase